MALISTVTSCVIGQTYSPSSSHASPQLEHSIFHKVLPVFSILSVFSCWVEAKVKRLEICFQGAKSGMTRMTGWSSPVLGQPSDGDFECSGDVKWHIHPSHVSKKSKPSGLDELRQLGWWTSLECYRGIGQTYWKWKYSKSQLNLQYRTNCYLDCLHF